MRRARGRRARWFMVSLRGRLLLWLLPTTILVGFLASGATYLGALVELDELLNDQLRAIAQHVSVDLEGRFALTDKQGHAEPLTGREPHGVLVQVWDGDKLEFSSDPDASLPPPQRAGLVELTLKGQTWHTFVSRDGDLQVRVAQVSVARWAALAEIAVQLL